MKKNIYIYSLYIYEKNIYITESHCCTAEINTVNQPYSINFFLKQGFLAYTLIPIYELEEVATEVLGEGRDPGQKKVTIPPAKHENHNFSTCSPTLSLACLFESSKNGTMLRDRVFKEVIKAK